MAQYSTTLEGLPIPRRKNDPRVNTPGLIYFNTTLNEYRFSSSNGWSGLATTDSVLATEVSAAEKTFQITVGDETTDLAVGTDKLTFRMPYGYTLTGVRASVNTAPTGASIIVDINEGGVSILSTEISIDIDDKTSTTSAIPAVISDANIADDAEITIDIDQVGSVLAGKGLKITLIGSKI